ncbi:MAG: class I SAM-dependent methyltransferase [Candidatus Omnitrophota bacterium]|nr:class I SAM-dependent methyltransferase [Candidatus Omnitrophota bacterium]
MPINKCRVCGHSFFEEPLLRYENMPRAAQYFPDKDTLQHDKGVNLEVCQCSGCGLVQLSNDPVPYYKEVIRAVSFSEEMKDFRIRQFSSFIEKYSLKGKKVIEIGCARGEYLSLMQQCGVDAYGLEYSEVSVAQCVKNGLEVSQGFVESSDCRLKNAPFGAFYILNFLEHLPDPNSILRGIYNNLADNAIGLIEVPNFDILCKRLFSEFIGDHLFYFTKETLTATLRLNGFGIIDCNETWHDYIISAVVCPVRSKLPKAKRTSNGVKKRRRLDISHFYKYQAQLKKEIEEYISRFKNKKVAIWGAGHQALAIISLMNLSNKIRYVVDSASFKQAKFTPATHIPIVSPDTLTEDPPDAIIVMAGSYCDEVARIIRQKFDRKINVSILRDFGLEKQ